MSRKVPSQRFVGLRYRRLRGYSDSLRRCVLTADCADGAPGIVGMHECIFAGPQREKIVESVKKGVPKAERPPAVSESIVRRSNATSNNSMNAAPYSRGSLPPRDRRARRESDETSCRRPRRKAVGHPLSERAEFLFGVSGVRVSEATVCRAVRRLNRAAEKRSKGHRAQRDEFS
jgi:hypothetical protein